MRANRDDDTPYVHERRESYTVPIVAGTIALLALLLYIGLREPDASVPDPAAQNMVRDSAVVAPPVIDNPASTTTQQAPATQAVPDGFSARQLSPPSSTVGAGAAPVSEAAVGERIVIDGQLLEELEEEAQSQGAAPATND